MDWIVRFYLLREPEGVDEEIIFRASIGMDINEDYGLWMESAGCGNEFENGEIEREQVDRQGKLVRCMTRGI